MEATKITRCEAYEANTEHRQSLKQKILLHMSVAENLKEFNENHKDCGLIISDCGRPYEKSDNYDIWCASEFCELFDCKLTTVRPRLSELKAEGKIEAVGITNDYGIREATYRLRKDDEIA